MNEHVYPVTDPFEGSVPLTPDGVPYRPPARGRLGAVAGAVVLALGMGVGGFAASHLPFGSPSEESASQAPAAGQPQQPAPAAQQPAAGEPREGGEGGEGGGD
jgi:hypothetical protein